MVKKSNNKVQDNDVEEVADPEENIVISDDNTDDDEICEVEHFRKLFIGGLAGQTNEDRLRQFYSKWGTVVDAVVMRDSVTRRSRGFGFVTYSKVTMVDKAQSNRPHIIDGKTVESKRALPRPEKQPAEGKKSASVKKLFVGGIKDVHEEQSLNTYFSEFGNVVSVQILKDNVTGKRRGFALVEYDDYDAVDKAILQKTHLVSNILLDVRKSVYTKDDDSKKSFEVRKERPDTAKNNVQYTNSKFVPPMASPMTNQNNRPEGGPLMKQLQLPYPGPPPYGQQPYHPMAPYQPGPPANNNHWGPQSGPRFVQPPNAYTQQPPPLMPQQPPPNMPPQNYSGYNQPPMPLVQPQVPPSGNWNNYQPTGNGNLWSGPPPPPQPPLCAQPPTSNWQNSQWGQQSALPVRPMLPLNSAPPMNWLQPPASQVAGPPPGMYQQPQNQQIAPPPPPPVPNNFGNGYQQNYAGGPTKHSNMHTNRMNPYSGPSNHYNNNSTAQGYGSGMTSGNRHRR